MKKRNLSWLLLCILLPVLLLCTNGCKDQSLPPPGWDELYVLRVENLDNLCVMFGEDYIYPIGLDVSNITVNSNHGNTLYYVRNKVEYIPQIACAIWDYVAENGLTITCGVYRDHNEISFAFVPDNETVELNGLTIYVNENSKYINYYFKAKSGYCVYADLTKTKYTIQEVKETIEAYIATFRLPD